MQSSEDAESGRQRSRRQLARALTLGLLLACGCAANRRHLDQAMQTPRSPNLMPAAAEPYTLSYPDVVDVRIPGQPDSPNPCAIGVDGRIDLGPHGRVYVEGQTEAQATGTIAVHTGVQPEEVQLHVQEYKSRQIYLLGEVTGLRHTVPYRGPETVADLLKRVGGITPGAQPSEVHVIRSHIPDGQAPEVFHVDVQAIYLKHDDRTNLVLQPFDQVYVGETRKSKLTRCFPNWLKPVYEGLFGLKQAVARRNEE